MAYPTNVMALFCEDIRAEEGNTLSLIGVFPDHLQLQDNNQDATPEGMQKVRVFPKFAIFVRIAFDPDADIAPPIVLLTMPGVEAVKLGEVAAETIAKAKREAKERGNLLGGAIFRATSTNFQVPRLGVAKVEVQIGKELYLAGSVNFSDLLPST